MRRSPHTHGQITGPTSPNFGDPPPLREPPILPGMPEGEGTGKKRVRSTLEWEAAPTSTDKLGDTPSESTRHEPVDAQRVGRGEWGAPATSTDNFGDFPHAKFNPTPLVGTLRGPRGTRAPLSTAGKIWKGFGSSRELPPGSPRVHLREPRGAAPAQSPLLAPLPRPLKATPPMGERGCG